MRRSDGGERSERELRDVILSWSVQDILNGDLYRNQMQKIPETFLSLDRYFESFITPLVEETRADLCSSLEVISEAPFAEVTAIEAAKSPKGKKSSSGVSFTYYIDVDRWRSESGSRGHETYNPKNGDILVISSLKLASAANLEQYGVSYCLAHVTEVIYEESQKELETNEGHQNGLRIITSKAIEVTSGMGKSFYATFLTNIVTNNRIWKALTWESGKDKLEIIKAVLDPKKMDKSISCTCSGEQMDASAVKLSHDLLAFNLNNSQMDAVLAATSSLRCRHPHPVKIIWGPPGTGKTKTVSTLLWVLLKINCRTLICAPTNVAVLEVCSRLVTLVKESSRHHDENFPPCCLLGDVVLFGNKDRMILNDDLRDIYLDDRIERLVECFAPLTGWKHRLASMIDLLEDGLKQYHLYLENEKEKVHVGIQNFLRKQFNVIAISFGNCVRDLCTHLPRSYVSNLQSSNIATVMKLLEAFGSLLCNGSVSDREVEEIFSRVESGNEDCLSANTVSADFDFEGSAIMKLDITRRGCLHILKVLRGTFQLPQTLEKDYIKDFCLRGATLIFCTASSSSILHYVAMDTMDVLVIDEAAQLKECESVIPLRLRGLRHAVLIGDECQLSSMVKSKVSEEVGFGRSLFERLASLGYDKHLLNTQYRMHPAISAFPNAKFYDSKILNGPNVKNPGYEKHYLSECMYGPYSFLNISDGREEKEEIGGSWKNMVEVAVVLKIISKLYKAWEGTGQRLTIGVVSPYTAQVSELGERIMKQYEAQNGFSVRVKSIDGFQGGEEDVIILSTVRSNSGGSVGFIDKLNRTNVALTRARHCLWILGNESTLVKSGSVWGDVVHDAKKRRHFFNADEDKSLSKAILDAKYELDQLDDLLKSDSILLKDARWKVLFSDDFRKSFAKLKSLQVRKTVIHLLLRLAQGWRPKNKILNFPDSFQLAKQCKIRDLSLVWMVDIAKDERYIQVLRVWDIIATADVPKLVKRLDNVFGMYTDDYIGHCKTKSLDGKLEVPMSWKKVKDIIRFRKFVKIELVEESVTGVVEPSGYTENSKVSDSLLLMKFYSLSSGIVKHLLTSDEGKEIDIPFEVTDQEQEIIMLPKSSFILGRSGTGKTTILTMKLIRREQQHCISRGLSGGFSEVSSKNELQENVEEVEERDFLRQIFITVSPKLCSAIRSHILRLKNFIMGGEYSETSGSIEMHDVSDSLAGFMNIPDSFINVPQNFYPLVITFQKFLMMLDGTVMNSFFDRFHHLKEFSADGEISKSTVLQSLIRSKEVNYDRFTAAYWPHFNSQLTNKLDSSTVFTQIISHIKGGLGKVGQHHVKLGREDYINLSETRVSILSSEQRERIYDIFLDYEKKKLANGEFDLSDLVMDLHRRLSIEPNNVEKVDFVYVDEVQDLTMRQIALFKYVCRNFLEGFVFAGDTAQTIARGIDFRFQDIRSLFYKEFISELTSVPKETGIEKEPRISKIFNLSQNFRTHDGVLKLAQSVVDLIYCFFPSSIDVLCPEASLIYGESPIVLESGNENAIMTIFGNGGNSNGGACGFGAEQVILVREECDKRQIFDHIGKQALVLTITECKGLEFQDVLLCNFFGASPLKNQWRVVYEYMKQQDLLDSTAPRSFPSFDIAKHNVLCSELKQLYVAITRTRQRLWICETVEENSKPMFDYWKRLTLVQVRNLDSSLVQSMREASTPEDWRLRGIKLFNEGNFEMATMCFERAGDDFREKWARAAGLCANADRILSSNFESARAALIQAAEIYETIGKADAAANCFVTIKEYKRAGMIYLEKCNESRLKDAGDCFTLSECWSLAAESYAKAQSFAAEAYPKAQLFTLCLSACTKGELFDMGLNLVEQWRQDLLLGELKKHQELFNIKISFLKNCAVHYFALGDKYHMMKLVKALPLVDLVDILSLNAETAHAALNQAAEIYERIGNAEAAATCLVTIKEYKRAGMIYLEKCGESRLKDAGDCLTLAKCWPLAVKAYAKAQLFSLCLSACFKGKLFDIGLNLIEEWEKNSIDETESHHDLNKIKISFLKNCAVHYFGLGDKDNMMNFVKAFHSMDLIRDFLKSRNLLEELIKIEMHSGNYIEAAEIARFKGDLLLEAEAYEKARNFKKASQLIFFHVVMKSLWTSGSKGWPMQHFLQKEELLMRAKWLAEQESVLFYESVCAEVGLLSDKTNSLAVISDHFNTAQKIQNTRLKFFAVRKILDIHLQSHPTKFSWESTMVPSYLDHANKVMPLDHFSIDTMIYIWDLWKEMVFNVISSLQCLEKPEHEYLMYEEFCLECLGVRKQDNQNTYIALNPEAGWIKENEENALQRDQNLVWMSACQFGLWAKQYWCSELLSVGMKVLERLEALDNFCKRSLLHLSRGKILIHMFQISKFPNEYESLEPKDCAKKLQKYLFQSKIRIFDLIFPLNLQTGIRESTVSICENGVVREMLEEILMENLNPQNEKLTHQQVGRAVLILFVFGPLTEELYKKINTYLKQMPTWKAFIEMLKTYSECGFGCVSLVCKFQEALRSTFEAIWTGERGYISQRGYISPHCFIYLIECLLFLASCAQGCGHFYFTTKFSLFQMLIYQNWKCIFGSFLAVPISQIQATSPMLLEFVVDVAERLLIDKQRLRPWLRSSYSNLPFHEDHDYQLLITRLVVVICLAHLNSGRYYHKIVFLLSRREFFFDLPQQFAQMIKKVLTAEIRDRGNCLRAVGEALEKISNSLVVVGSEVNRPNFSSLNAIFVTPEVIQSRDVLIQRSLNALLLSQQSSEEKDQIRELSSNNSRESGFGLIPQVLGERQSEDDDDLQRKYMQFWTILDDLQSEAVENSNDVQRCCNKMKEVIFVLDAAMTLYQDNNPDEGIFREITGMLDELKQLSNILVRDKEVVDSISAIREIVRKCRDRRPKLQPLMDSLLLASTRSSVEKTDPPVTSSISKTKGNKGKGSNKSRQKKKGNKSKKR